MDFILIDGIDGIELSSRTSGLDTEAIGVRRHIGDVVMHLIGIWRAHGYWDRKYVYIANKAIVVLARLLGLPSARVPGLASQLRLVEGCFPIID